MGTQHERGASRTPLSRDEREALAHTEELLDQALADTFPASDPVSSLKADTPPGLANGGQQPAVEATRG
jgi:hypothetical protein